MKLHMNSNDELKEQSLNPLDETEDLHINITDELLNQSKLMAYNVGLQAKDDRGKTIPVVPKKFPEKAIDIIFPIQQIFVEIFLDTNTKKWDSNIDYNNQQLKLSPDQFEQFFMSQFYAKLIEKLQNEWPLSDKLYGSLYKAVLNKEMLIGQNSQVVEDGQEDKEQQLANKDIDGDKKRDYTASGRKITKFSDMKVSSDSARFFCWPNKNKLDHWSTWKDWKKIKPLCRIRFKHGKHIYGVSLSAIKENYKNRGFRAYCIDILPHLQWLTREETEQVMKLSIVNKFIRHCISQISQQIQYKPEEIYEKINNKDKITIEEIAMTQSVIRKTLNNIIKNKQIDSFKWSD